MLHDVLSIPSLILAGAAGLLLAAPSAAQTTWTVDSAGGADFDDLQPAVASALVQPGDILLVAEGGYSGGFTLDKPLTIVGAASTTQITGTLTVQTAGDCTLAGLEFHGLVVKNCPGAVLLDDIVAGIPFSGCDSFTIQGCDNVVIQRSTLTGKPSFSECASPGVRILLSRVSLTDCTVDGGDWGSSAFAIGNGKPGIEIGSSTVLLARTAVTGGDGGTPTSILAGNAGDGASAITVDSGACTLRGDGATTITGGQGGSGAAILGPDGDDAIWAVSGTGTLTSSGVVLAPPAVQPLLTVVQPSPAQPFLRIVGTDDGPGAGKTLQVHGPAGNAQLILVSAQSVLGSFPAKIDGALYVNPGAVFAIFPLTTAGQATPVSVLFHVPNDTGLVGASAVFQGFAQGLGAGGTWLAENPALIVVR
ncbi:MAG TPA: hypothetical protein VK824_05910 [Planctomycetota bacterium]|nr:hypothetical protein [Planctomycetota bacterium]